MSAKWTLLVIDMNAMYKQIPIAMDKTYIEKFKSAYRGVKKRIMYISAKFVNWRL